MVPEQKTEEITQIRYVSKKYEARRCYLWICSESAQRLDLLFGEQNSSCVEASCPRRTSVPPSQQALPSTHFCSGFCGFQARCHIQRSWRHSTADPFPAISRSGHGHLLGLFLQFRTADSLARPRLCSFCLCRRHGPLTFSLDCFFGLPQTLVLVLGVSDSLRELVNTLSN